MTRNLFSKTKGFIHSDGTPGREGFVVHRAGFNGAGPSITPVRGKDSGASRDLGSLLELCAAMAWNG